MHDIGFVRISRSGIGRVDLEGDGGARKPRLQVIHCLFVLIEHLLVRPLIAQIVALAVQQCAFTRTILSITPHALGGGLGEACGRVLEEYRVRCLVIQVGGNPRLCCRGTDWLLGVVDNVVPTSIILLTASRHGVGCSTPPCET
jgi:hypothetical protein